MTIIHPSFHQHIIFFTVVNENPHINSPKENLWPKRKRCFEGWAKRLTKEEMDLHPNKHLT